MNPTFDPKVCPKCVQKTADGFNESEAKGNSFTDNTYVDAAQSHRSELNRRPLLVQCGVIFGKSGLLNNIAGEVSAKTGRKTDSTRPERVSEVCLAFRSAAASITKLFRRNRLHTPPFPSAREQQENRWLAADCELNLFGLHEAVMRKPIGLAAVLDVGAGSGEKRAGAGRAGAVVAEHHGLALLCRARTPTADADRRPSHLGSSSTRLSPDLPLMRKVPGGDDVNVDRHPVIDPRLIASQAEKIQFARDVEPNFETGDRPQIDPFRYRRYLVLGWIRDTDGTPPYYSLTSNGENIWRWWRNGEEW